MSKHQKDSRIFKLQGNPLVLFRGGRLKLFNRRYKNMLIKHVSKMLRKKSDVLIPIVNELRNGFNIPGYRSTLFPEYIHNYLYEIGKNPILVLWNGASDMDILNRLNIHVPVSLNLTAYDEYDNSQFYLKLINYANGELICSLYVGTYVKNGRMLSLSETHSLVCSIDNHSRTNVHDPVVDVLFTKCIFNYLITSQGYSYIFYQALKEWI